MTVENRFDSPVLVHEIELPDEAKPYFKLTLPRHHRSMPIVLPVGKPYPLLSLEFTPSPQLSHFSTVFRLLTNYSSFELPLFAYRGRLDLVSLCLDSLLFGSLILCVYLLPCFSLFPTPLTRRKWTSVWWA